MDDVTERYESWERVAALETEMRFLKAQLQEHGKTLGCVAKNVEAIRLSLAEKSGAYTAVQHGIQFIVGASGIIIGALGIKHMP